MKCPNCAANYASRDIACPYCGTPNPRGVLWVEEKNLAQDELERVREALPALRRVALNRILNRALAIELGIFLVLFIGAFLFFFLTEAGLELRNQIFRGNISAQLETLYEEERYGELYSVLDEYNLFGQEQYEYSQMALLYRDYEDFCQDRLEYFSELDAGEVDLYTLESLISSIHDLFHPDIPAYPNLTKNNAQKAALYAREARAFAQGVLGLEEEELNLMLTEEYLYTDQFRSIVDSVRERSPKA